MEENKEASAIEDLQANVLKLVAHSQAETKKAEAALAQASENIKNITTAELQAITNSNNRQEDESANGKSPEALTESPQVTQVFFGLMILLGRVQDWAQIKQALAKADFVQVLLASEPESAELLAALEKHIAQNQATFTDQGLSKLNAATAYVRDWLVAIKGKHEAQKAVAKAQTIREQAEQHIEQQSKNSAADTETAKINQQIIEQLDDGQGRKKRRTR